MYLITTVKRVGRRNLTMCNKVVTHYHDYGLKIPMNCENSMNREKTKIFCPCGQQEVTHTQLNWSLYQIIHNPV